MVRSPACADQTSLHRLFLGLPQGPGKGFPSPKHSPFKPRTVGFRFTCLAIPV